MDKNQQAIVDDGKIIKWMHWGLRAAIALAIAAVAYVLLPYGVSFAENTFQLTLALGKTALIGIPLFFGLSTLWASRDLFKRVQERIVNRLWEVYIYDDPIKFISEEVVNLRNAQGLVKGATTSLREVLGDLSQMAQDMINTATEKFNLAEHSMTTDERQAALYASFAQQRLDSVNDIKESALEVEEAIEVVTEIAQFLDLTVQEMEHTLEMMRHEMKLQSIKSFAADTARSAIDGTTNKNVRLAIAQRAYREKISKYSANFKSFMVDVEPLLKAQRIGEVIATAEGKKALQKFKDNKESLGGLKDFHMQLDEAREALGKHNPSYKPDLNRVKSAPVNPLTRNTKNKFSGLN